MKTLILMIGMGLIAQITAVAEINPVGTWNGTWYNSGYSDTLTMVVAANGTLTGTFRQPLSAYPDLGLSGVITVPLTGTYKDTSDGSFKANTRGSTTVYGSPVKYTIVAQGTVSGDNISGIDILNSWYYYNGKWWRLDNNSIATFTAHRTSLPTKATTPWPISGANDQSIDIELSWVNGGGATSYNVYFGTNTT